MKKIKLLSIIAAVLLTTTGLALAGRGRGSGEFPNSKARGPLTGFSPQAMERLALSDDQREAVDKLRDEMRNARRERFATIGDLRAKLVAALDNNATSEADSLFDKIVGEKEKAQALRMKFNRQAWKVLSREQRLDLIESAGASARRNRR